MFVDWRNSQMKQNDYDDNYDRNDDGGGDDDDDNDGSDGGRRRAEKSI